SVIVRRHWLLAGTHAHPAISTVCPEVSGTSGEAIQTAAESAGGLLVEFAAGLAVNRSDLAPCWGESDVNSTADSISGTGYLVCVQPLCCISDSSSQSPANSRLSPMGKEESAHLSFHWSIIRNNEPSSGLLASAVPNAG